MGHRLEIFTSEAAAGNMIKTAAAFGIEAKIVGRVEAAGKKELQLHAGNEVITY
jgi:phosphoribosylformylglycinamidine cyclo-ligase